MSKYNVEMQPYCEVDGCWTYSDREMKAFLDRMDADGNLEKAFVGWCDLDRDNIVRHFKRPDVVVYIVYVDGEVGALTWLDSLHGMSAQIHFCTFPDMSMRKRIAGGKYVINTLINETNENGEPVIDVITGITPTEFSTACRFVRLIGMKFACNIPGIVWNAKKQRGMEGQISYITRAAQ